MEENPGPCAGSTRPLDVDDPSAEGEDSQFFVRMFKHDFGDPPWRRPAGKVPTGIVLTSDRWGAGDSDLGHLLVRDLLQTMAESKEQPAWLFLVNTAVRLGLKGADCLAHLQKLEGLGVKILVSKTSLYHLGVETELRVGEAITMLDLVAVLYRADKVISL